MGEMISDSCLRFLKDNNLDSLITDLSYYSNMKTFSDYYSNDIKIRCQWILLNYSDYDSVLNRDPSKDIYLFRTQVQKLLSDSETRVREPRITEEELADVDTGWSF